MRRILPTVLSLSLCACSFVGVQGPPAEDPGPRPLDCTTSVALPAIDSLAALAIGSLAVVAFASAGQGDEGGLLAVTVGIPAAVLGVTYGISAVRGTRAVHACSEMNDRRPRRRAALRTPGDT